MCKTSYVELLEMDTYDLLELMNMTEEERDIKLEEDYGIVKCPRCGEYSLEDCMLEDEIESGIYICESCFDDKE